MENEEEARLAELDGQIAAIAYSLWEQYGRPNGRDVEFWLMAEDLVLFGKVPLPIEAENERVCSGEVAGDLGSSPGTPETADIEH